MACSGRELGDASLLMSNAQLQFAIRRVQATAARVERQRQLVARLECSGPDEAIELALETLIILEHSLALGRYQLSRLEREMGVSIVNRP